MNGRRSLRAGAAGLLVPLLAGCGTTTFAPPSAPGPPTAAVPTAPTFAWPARTPALGRAEPVTLAVPAIGVHTGPLPALGLDARGALEAPPDGATAGWFTLGPPPGTPGPAVIAGAFDRLPELVPGDEISVTRADGTTAVFGTYHVERYPPSGFPTDRVYGNTTGPELRLVTGGPSGVIAYARLVRVA